MRRSVWVDPRIDRLTVAHVRAYLTTHGWKEEPFPRPELLVFRAPKDDDDGLAIETVLPSRESMIDYPLRIEDLVGVVAWYEDRKAAEVITDMLGGAGANGADRPRPAGAEAEKA